MIWTHIDENGDAPPGKLTTAQSETGVEGALKYLMEGLIKLRRQVEFQNMQMDTLRHRVEHLEKCDDKRIKDQWAGMAALERKLKALEPKPKVKRIAHGRR